MNIDEEIVRRALDRTAGASKRHRMSLPARPYRGSNYQEKSSPETQHKDSSLKVPR